jgi:hypothetical protein
MGCGFQQRSEREWKFGMVQSSQNAFVSGPLKKISGLMVRGKHQTQEISRQG